MFNLLAEGRGKSGGRKGGKWWEGEVVGGEGEVEGGEGRSGGRGRGGGGGGGGLQGKDIMVF